MHLSIALFVGRALQPEEVAGKRVLEVGACNVNGSVRDMVLNWGRPAEYVGVDLEAGPGVDRVVPAEGLVDAFGAESFDVVLVLEVMEHVQRWKAAIHNLKQVCRSGGVVLITTRGKGFKYHGYPHDHWRFAPEDMARIFADCEILLNEADPQDPGVLLKVRKPESFAEVDLAPLDLYCIMTGRREREYEAGFVEHPCFRRIQARLQRHDRRKAFRRWRQSLMGRITGR